ncbi:pirin family protein [Glaciecola petra]|uniref:Pirin family protein n=1 Tax=Glaciecola petra TaxID=3075602 RepID=A0ABU2ZQW2_9ALTE|nr:pirin family protein [Aestuariibacter sp. P117]MDT0595002.1 pirin family protein [Aestuariibacter sp. P117]
MQYIRRANERGTVDLGWLQSQHSFSFGHYYDAAHMGLSVLRVINDDIVQPGRGFDTHGHQDMEIISYVVSGAVEHKDNQGNKTRIPAGDVQRMSAGTGIMHSEYNPSENEEVNFLQIWVLPEKKGLPPSYEQKTIEQQTQLTALVTPTGDAGSLSINQNMSMHRLVLGANETFTLQSQLGFGYLHIVKGQLSVDKDSFVKGDAFATSAKEAIKLIANSDLEAIWFDLPSQV